MCDNYHRHGRVLDRMAARVRYWNKCCRRCPRSFCSGATKKESQNEHSCLKTASGREESGLGNCVRVHRVPALPPSPALPAALRPVQGRAQGAIPAQRPPSAARSCTRPGSGPARSRSRSGRGPGCGGRTVQGELHWVPAVPHRARALSGACSAGKGA